MKLACIDADTLIYEASLSSERPIEWAEDEWTLHSYLPEGIAHFERLVEDIKDATKATHVLMALSSNKPRWRNLVMPTYKANRKRVRRPVIFHPLRQYCKDAYKTIELDGLEGDDVLGIEMTNGDGIAKVCVSIDKDLQTIPGEHYNSGRKEEFHASVNQADHHHLYQTLTGDSTDGYSGCPKIGPVNALRILAPYYSDFDVLDRAGAWKAVVAAYKKAGLSEGVALENAQVARICRAEDYNEELNKVTPWTPNE